jgi:hypothetical protein
VDELGHHRAVPQEDREMVGVQNCHGAQFEESGRILVELNHSIGVEYSHGALLKSGGRCPDDVGQIRRVTG